MMWESTGETLVEPCGCILSQQIELGGAYHHERWMPYEQCIAHARVCPDGARCWHNCGEGPCWRVANCGPLSGVFPDDEWPA